MTTAFAVNRLMYVILHPVHISYNYSTRMWQEIQRRIMEVDGVLLSFAKQASANCCLNCK